MEHRGSGVYCVIQPGIAGLPGAISFCPLGRELAGRAYQGDDGRGKYWGYGGFF